MPLPSLQNLPFRVTPRWCDLSRGIFLAGARCSFLWGTRMGRCRVGGAVRSGQYHGPCLDGRRKDGLGLRLCAGLKLSGIVGSAFGVLKSFLLCCRVNRSLGKISSIARSYTRRQTPDISNPASEPSTSEPSAFPNPLSKLSSRIFYITQVFESGVSCKFRPQTGVFCIISDILSFTLLELFICRV
jgi:hypothetical protein